MDCSPKNLKKLAFSKFGDPLEVLELVDDEVPPKTLQPGQVHVRVLYSPINQGDLAKMKQYLPFRTELPAVSGFEGVVEVVECGGGDGSTLKVGDRAVIKTLVGCTGTWRQEFVIEEKFLYKVPTELPLEAAATLIANQTTAYLLLNAVIPLEPGDCLIQNAASSSVGQTIIQLAKLSGIKTINVVRKRPNITETIDLLKQLGADVVITDEELSRGLKMFVPELPEPKLGLDCVGGKASTDMAELMTNGGTLVVFGTLSGHPLMLNQMTIIMQDLHVSSFALQRWLDKEKRADEFANVLGKLVELYSTGKLLAQPCKKFLMQDWQQAFEFYTQPYTNTKVLLQFNC